MLHAKRDECKTKLTASLIINRRLLDAELRRSWQLRFPLMIVIKRVIATSVLYIYAGRDYCGASALYAT